MDVERFDALARLVGTAATRRQAIGPLLGGRVFARAATQGDCRTEVDAAYEEYLRLLKTWTDLRAIADDNDRWANEALDGVLQTVWDGVVGGLTDALDVTGLTALGERLDRAYDQLNAIVFASRTEYSLAELLEFAGGLGVSLAAGVLSSGVALVLASGIMRGVRVGQAHPEVARAPIPAM